MATKPQPPIGRKPESPAAVIDEVVESLRATAEEVVPWFLEQMPLMYFQDTDEATQRAHLRAIIAAKASDRPIELTQRSEDGSQWTFMRPLDYPGVLAELMSDLPQGTLRKAKIHTADDGSLVIDTFEFGEAPAFSPDDPHHAQKVEETVAYAAEHVPSWSADAIRDYLRRCTEDYVLAVTPLRKSHHWELFSRVTGTDGSSVRLEREADPAFSRIVVAVSNATRRSMLQRIATRLSKSRINIHRAYLDSVHDDANGWITLIGCVVQGPDGGHIDEDSELWAEVRHDLLRLKWYDQRTLALGYREPSLGLEKAEIILALLDLSYQTLVKINPYAFNPDRIEALARGNLDLTSAIADLFRARFDPGNPLSDEDFEQAVGELGDQVEARVDLEDARAILHHLLVVVTAVRRTNLYVEDRYALAMRIDPTILVTADRSEHPFGVFFVHGRDFNGFHVRFRDIARGGVRAITPRGIEEHAREQERLYDEAYSLAFAQQLKNKDIPEGGAKAAILVHPDGRSSRSVKAFVNSLLDLVTPDEATRRCIVDPLDHEELIYLGPDENITVELIKWIVDRAARRGYAMPAALMSSKPGAGINHKEYGVTSEGVVVFLDTALRAMGIDPENQSFTVKITGGPDGDVAGNAIRILVREYGKNVQFVGIADASGCAEDPEGLDHKELLRLVSESLPVSDFDRDKLASSGNIASIEDEDGVHLRNTLHDRVVSDAFLPCGGRPATIHAGNWRNFLTDEGVPSSRLIVEGANLFLTPDARRELSNLGVVIVKDSSANKCGVICSSFEIGACMLLEESTFLEIKDVFVEQVLDRLRTLARLEAELLLREHQHHPNVPLPDMSIRISKVMMKVADAIVAGWEDLTQEQLEELSHLVNDHLPAILVERAGDGLWTAMPAVYLQWMMAKSLSARIVYREGFEYLETMEDQNLAGIALRYLDLERERQSLIENLMASGLPDKERMAMLLQDAGIFSTMGRRKSS